MIDLSLYRTAVFDFDGVILDSNQAKTDAFRTTLEGDPPELIDRFIEYHKTNGGVSRYEKFRCYYRDILGMEAYDDAADDAVARFGEHSWNALMSAAEIPGAVRALEILRASGTPSYVVSGGAEHEVRKVVTARGLDPYFASVHGSPTSKTEHLATLRDAGKLRNPGIYFGDARLDMEAALAFGLTFVFIAGFSEWADGARVCAERNCVTINDFESLR